MEKSRTSDRAASIDLLRIHAEESRHELRPRVERLEVENERLQAELDELRDTIPEGTDRRNASCSNHSFGWRVADELAREDPIHPSISREERTTERCSSARIHRVAGCSCHPETGRENNTRPRGSRSERGETVPIAPETVRITKREASWNPQ